MLNKNQSQVVDADGTAVQAGRDVTLNVTKTGLTYAEVKEVALDVFRANFYQLKGAAMQLAQDRGEQVTEKFLNKLQDENPSGLQQANNPDFQDALFTVQKEYAKAGDKELGDLLVDLLVDRTKQENRNILQIVLNESLHTAPKLTSQQLSLLALIFFLRYTKNASRGTHQLLSAHLARHVQPFADNFAKNDAAFQHLEFTGCGTGSIGEISLEEIFRINFGGLFNKGFDAARIQELGISIGPDPSFFIPCLNDTTKMQVRAVEETSLQDALVASSLAEQDKQKIKQLFNEEIMSHDEIRAKVIEHSPFMGPIFSAWSSSQMKSFNLTSVGMAIGHANIKRLAGEFAPLSIWVN